MMEIEGMVDTTAEIGQDASTESDHKVLVIDGMAVVNQIDMKNLQNCRDFKVVDHLEIAIFAKFFKIGIFVGLAKNLRMFPENLKSISYVYAEILTFVYL